MCRRQPAKYWNNDKTRRYCHGNNLWRPCISLCYKLVALFRFDFSKNPIAYVTARTYRVAGPASNVPPPSFATVCFAIGQFCITLYIKNNLKYRKVYKYRKICFRNDCFPSKIWWRMKMICLMLSNFFINFPFNIT